MLILTAMVLDLSASLTATFLTHNENNLEFNGKFLCYKQRDKQLVCVPFYHPAHLDFP